MEILEKIFGGSAKVKIMRLFLYNPKTIYDKVSISGRARVPLESISKEMSHFERIGLVRRRQCVKEEAPEIGEKKGPKKKVVGWVLDSTFPYLLPLQGLLINPDMIKHQAILRRIMSAGKIKLLILSGLFIQDPASRVDLLIVGDNLRKGALENILRNIEAELGKELRYAAFETADFKYRISVYDKLIRDILDYPHEKVLDKIGVK